MRTLQETNELTGKIMSAESSIASINYRLNKIVESAAIRARVNLEYFQNKRNSMTLYATREEVIFILNRMLKEEFDKLEKLKEEYNKDK